MVKYTSGWQEHGSYYYLGALFFILLFTAFIIFVLITIYFIPIYIGLSIVHQIIFCIVTTMIMIPSILMCYSFYWEWQMVDKASYRRIKMHWKTITDNILEMLNHNNIQYTESPVNLILRFLTDVHKVILIDQGRYRLIVESSPSLEITDIYIRKMEKGDESTLNNLKKLIDEALPQQYQ